MVMKQIQENLRYILTTKITIQQSNKIVKYIEETLDAKSGEVSIIVRRGKIHNIRREINDYEEGESENDE